MDNRRLIWKYGNVSDRFWTLVRCYGGTTSVRQSLDTCPLYVAGKCWNRQTCLIGLPLRRTSVKRDPNATNGAAGNTMGRVVRQVEGFARRRFARRSFAI